MLSRARPTFSRAQKQTIVVSAPASGPLWCILNVRNTLNSIAIWEYAFINSIFHSDVHNPTANLVDSLFLTVIDDNVSSYFLASKALSPRITRSAVPSKRGHNDLCRATRTIWRGIVKRFCTQEANDQSKEYLLHNMIVDHGVSPLPRREEYKIMGFSFVLTV